MGYLFGKSSLYNLFMNLIRALGVGAVSLLAIGGWRYFGSLQKRAHLPSKEQTLTVLENIRREFYPVLVKIADLVTRQLIPRGIPPEANEQLVMENAAIKAEIETINQRVYSQFSEEDIREATEKLYKEDGDIIRQKHEFRQEYKKALLGIKPESQMTASRKLNKAKMLETVREILEDKLARLQTLRITEMEPHDQRLLLEGDVEQDERATKQRVKAKLGLSASDSISIFHFAVARYIQEDENFKNQYEKILENYSQKVRKIIPSQ